MAPEMDSLKAIRDEIKVAEGSTTNLKEKAVTDLRFLCSRLGLGLLNNVEYHALYDNASKKLSDIYVTGYEKGTKNMAGIPDRLLKDDMYIAVVSYDNGVVKDAYLFEGKNFTKKGFFSMFKHDKKVGMYTVDVSNDAKLKEYSFGNVVEKITGTGA